MKQERNYIPPSKKEKKRNYIPEIKMNGIMIERKCELGFWPKFVFERFYNCH